MNDQEFDKLLYQRATDLSPEPLSGPWHRALGFICWGLALISMTLSVLPLQHILPALGSVLLYLGFRSLRKTNRALGICYWLSAIQALYRATVLLLNATPFTQNSGATVLLSFGGPVLTWLIFFALWRGLKKVFRQAGQKTKTRSAGGLVICYTILFLLALGNVTSILLWPLLLLWVCLLAGLFKTSKILDQAGYAIAPTPVRLQSGWIALFYLAGLLPGILLLLLAFSRFPAQVSAAQLETGQAQLRSQLVELGFPEDVLTDLTDEEVALLEGAYTVQVNPHDTRPDRPDELDGLTLRFIQVELPGGAVRYILWFRWDRAPEHRLRDGLEIIPDYHDALTMNYAAPVQGRVLWENGAQLYQTPLEGCYGSHTRHSIFFVSSSYQAYTFQFSLPRQGDHIRGYVTYGMYAAHPGLLYHFNAEVRYAHQEFWACYPWVTPIQYQRSKANNTDPFIPAHQFIPEFSLGLTPSWE